MDEFLILAMSVLGLYLLANALFGGAGSNQDHVSDGKKHYGKHQECDLDGVPFARKGSAGARKKGGYYGPRL